MSDKHRLKPRRVWAFVGSAVFFRLTVVLLVAGAVWIALSGRYPMAFDENFHLGIIRLYAHHPSPFWHGQPIGADAYGAVSRDPSYLYQYLMSFPYRFISALTGNQAAQVLFLRAINIALFAWGMTLYRRLLLKTGASRAVVHFCLFIFILIPVTPLLAAQINYDNLLLPLTALTLLCTLRLRRELNLPKPKLDVYLFIQLLLLCFLVSLVKFAFLPIFVTIVGYLGFSFWKSAGFDKLFVEQLPRLKRPAGLLLVILLVVSSGLFIERYAVNIVDYHKISPDCSEVLSVAQCSQYGPWYRDYLLQQEKVHGDSNPLAFTQHWFYGMWFRSTFAVDGPATNFQTRGPLVMPGGGIVVFAALAGLALALTGRRIWRRYDNSALWLFSIVTLIYTISLWGDEFRAYIRTGQPVAINGRYLWPVLPLILVISALALKELTWRRPRLQAGLAGVAVLCLLWGGGALTYILRSNDTWYWPNQAVRSSNHAVQRVLGPVTPGYKQPTLYLH